MYRKFLKRVFDLLFFLLALPFLLIVLLVVAPLIYFEDKGSIFYNAPRLGKNGRIFIMYKFRTMKMNAPDLRNEDGSTFNSEDDPRLTKIGRFLRKTSLDETPQLLNVLKGDMSIIGPRPDLPEAIDYYTTDQAKKLKVRPGITGYSQALYRNSIVATEKFDNDVFYVSNVSLILDIKIFILTVISVFLHRNVYRSNYNQNEIVNIEK